MPDIEPKDSPKSTKDTAKEIKAAQEEMKNSAMELLGLEAKEAVAKAKMAGVQPYFAQIHDEMFIYRSLTRFEWRAHLLHSAELAKKLAEANGGDNQAANIDGTLRNEEELVIKCVLFPKVDQMSIKEYPAGYIETLANTIMSTSGFNVNPITIKL